MSYNDTLTIGYTVAAGKYEIGGKKLMLKSLIPAEVRVKIKIDDIRFENND